MEKRKGGPFYQRWAAFRASAGELTNYLPYLSQVVLGAEPYSRIDPKTDSAYFVVEATVRRMFPFKKDEIKNPATPL